MSAEYDAACEVRGAIDALDDEDRGLARIASAMDRLADCAELAMLRQLAQSPGAPTELTERARAAFAKRIDEWLE